MTTKTNRRKATVAQTATVDDNTLCDVDIKDGIAVYWQEEQRGGTLRNVPKAIAMQWLQAGYATSVHDPK